MDAWCKNLASSGDLRRWFNHDPTKWKEFQIPTKALSSTCRYFIERKLYPHVDFYSDIMMRAIGIPLQMFTVIFAIGRMPGWIANYREVSESADGRIYRPREIYIGEPLASYIPIDQSENR